MTPSWAVQVQADHRALDLDFEGEGTRTGGVTDARGRPLPHGGPAAAPRLLER
ncbi:MAG: hypothetical protein R3F43_02190 [bacterium]